MERRERFPHRDVTLAVALAGALGAFLLIVLPRGGDTAAHLYRTLLVEDGVLLWDTFWYGGHYPLAGYSPLYHPLAALFGNVPLALLASVAAAGLFASVARREWGEAGRWPALAFALVAPAPVILGQWPYAVGLAAALAAIRALEAGRASLVLAAAALTLAVSPLAFAFLCLALLAAGLVRPTPRRRRAVLAGRLAGLAALQLVMPAAFPAPQEFPFPAGQLVVALAALAPAAALGVRGARRDPLTAFLLVWAATIVVAFLAPVPLGENVTRPRWLLFPLVLALAARAAYRPRWLAAAALAVALLYNGVPYVDFIRGAPLSREHDAAFWDPPLDFLAERGSADFRVEIVPTASNWEALYVPRAGHPIARGWFRQLDLADNPELYEEELDPARYEEWLRANAVRYVVLPRFRLDQRGAEAEATLLRSGEAGLTEVSTEPDWTIYELPDATPLLTGPGEPRIIEHGHDRIAGAIDEPGTYRLRVRHTPYWRVAQGDACLERSAAGDTLLRVDRAGPFTLEVAGGLRELARSAVRRNTSSC